MEDDNGANSEARRDAAALQAAYVAREAVIAQMDTEGGWDYFIGSSGARIGALAYGFVAAGLRDGTTSVSLVTADEDDDLGGTLTGLRDAAVTAELTAASGLFNALEASFDVAFRVGAKAAADEFLARRSS